MTLLGQQPRSKLQKLAFKTIVPPALSSYYRRKLIGESNSMNVEPSHSERSLIPLGGDGQ